MYKRDLLVALINLKDDMLEAITSVPIPSSLCVKFSQDIENNVPDAIIVSIIDSDIKKLDEIISKNADADIIVIAEPMQTEELRKYHSVLKDIWVAPTSSCDADAKWRFGHYIDSIKKETDAWEVSQFLESTINSIPSLVWFKTSDGVHEKVNDAFCEATGKTKEQAQGARHAYIWDVEYDDPACIESERQVMETRSTVVSEEVIQVGDDTRILTTYKSPLYNYDGTPMGTSGIGIDITKERAYKQELLEKNQTLETILTSLQCGVLVHSLDGTRVISANKSALELLGYDSTEDMLEDGFDMVAASVLEEDATRIRAGMANMRNVGDTISVEYRVHHKDGTELHLLGSVKLIEDNGEKLFQRFMIDITERKREEDQREQQQHDLVQALSEDYLLVCSFNLDTGKGTTLRIESNEQTHLNSYFSGELNLGTSIGAYIDDAVMKEDRAMLRSSLSAVNLLEELADTNRIYVNYRTKRYDKIAYCQATVVRTGDWADNRNVVIGFRNVDLQTREEMKKKALLEEALEGANRASEAKTAFLNNMSHDIRTPMNAIVGFTSLASSRIDHPDKVMDYLDKIKHSSMHLLSLINDILDMSRIESGEVSLTDSPCSISELLDSIHAIMASDIEVKRIHFEIETDIEHPNVVCDKLRINQVMLNLLGNAVKFTPEGRSVKMKVRELNGVSHGYSRYRFTIEDTGIGMSEEFVSKIFDPFERERTSTISGLEGTGLGMAITKNLVDRMGGTISVVSEQGVGTTFTIDLALRLDERTEEEIRQGTKLAVPSDIPPQVNHPMRGSHILLVDDNMMNREIAMTLLEDEGFTLEYAVDGQDAVDKLVEAGPGHFDLILMDIQMPVLNGYEATKKIRKLDDPLLAGIPVIAVTADAFEEDKQKAIRAGMNGHVSKPIEMNKLFDALSAILVGR